MRYRLSSIVAIAVLVGACGSSGPTAAPTAGAPTEAATTAPTPTAAAAPTAAPSASSDNPFAGQPFSLDLPDGWQTFDLNDPAGKSALDAFTAANPQMAGAIAAFQSMPGVVFATNPLLGNVVVALSLPTGGVSLDALKQSFNAQFMAIPGLVGTPVAEDVTLPVGPAVHWDLKLSVNGAGGKKVDVAESLYLVENGTSAVLVEFVATGGAPVPQEAQIMQSLKFS